MRATIETHENSDRLPPVHVLVSLGDEDVSIKVRTRRLFTSWSACCGSSLARVLRWFTGLKPSHTDVSEALLFTLVAPNLCPNWLRNNLTAIRRNVYSAAAKL